MIVSLLIVSIQIMCIVVIAFSGRFFPIHSVFLVLQVLLLLFAFSAAAEMKFRFNIFPQLLKNSSLVTSGPFRFVRHPIYTSALLITLIWVADDFSYVRLVAWLVLAFDLIIKIRIEEKNLLERFPEYRDYMSGSSALIPFIY